MYIPDGLNEVISQAEQDFAEAIRQLEVIKAVHPHCYIGHVLSFRARVQQAYQKLKPVIAERNAETTTLEKTRKELERLFRFTPY